MNLVFVYNADSGMFNTLSDIAHKTLSPSTYNCNLCKITHGLLKEKSEWTNFIQHIGVSCEFLHKNEFLNIHKESNNQFPSIYSKDNKNISLIVSQSEINSCNSINDLKILIKNAI